MSLDQPFYQELKRRRHPGAKWWAIGDPAYYLGLLGAIGFGCAAPFRPWAAWAAAASVAVFIFGVACKRRSYALGARDGIHVDEF
jgi:hypothetical protein